MNKTDKFSKILEEGKKIFAKEQIEKIQYFTDVLFDYRLQQTEEKRTELKRFFHSLKGAGASFGLNHISKVGKEYEDYISNTQLTDINSEYFSKLLYGIALINKSIKDLSDEVLPSKKNPDNIIDTKYLLEKYYTDNSESHVLLIDDDKSLLFQLEKLLNSEGYKTISSSKPENFIEVLKENKIDILLLDVMLPKINGLEFFNSLRNKNIFVPTILITSDTNLNIKLKAYEIGAEDYITKPFDLNELVVRVNRVIKNSKNSKNMIYKDIISGAYNKTLLNENLKAAKFRYLNRKESCCFCLIDIDSFANINTNFGYDSGDYVLSEFKKELSSNLDKNVQIYRLNQDDFLIMFPDTSEFATYNIMEKINVNIKNKNFSISNKGVANIKFSGSITSLKNSREDILDILERLNKDMLKAKSSNLSGIYFNNKEKTIIKDYNKSKTILIIDDMNSIIFLIKKHFEELGYIVDYSLNGKDGLEKIKKLKPDIILLDIMLPEINGFEILKSIKKVSLSVKSKIIIMSSHSKNDFIESCKKHGANSYIIKPISLIKLHETINSL